MEVKGRLPYSVDTTLHFGERGRSTYRTAVTKIERPVDEWHTYALEWKEKEMIWYVDGATVFTLSSDEWWSQSALDSETAPFDVDFFILINLAVGGNFDGGKEPPADFTSACMEVDYVRVYSEN